MQVCIVNSTYCMFIFFTGNYWNNAHNRRKFFIAFASQKGFDPLVAVSWENIQYREMVKQVKRKHMSEREGGERWRFKI